MARSTVVICDACGEPAGVDQFGDLSARIPVALANGGHVTAEVMLRVASTVVDIDLCDACLARIRSEALTDLGLLPAPEPVDIPLEVRP